jgi:hypothetical protein
MVQVPIVRRFTELSLEEESVLFRNRVHEVYEAWWERERTPEDIAQEEAELRQAGLNPDSEDEAEVAAAIEWLGARGMKLAIEIVQREWEEKAQAREEELKRAG